MELELSDILGFAVPLAVFILFWELTPVRTWFYKLKMRCESAMILFSTTKPGRFVKQHSRLFHFVEDFALFLFVFKWKDGLIFDTISSCVVRFLENHPGIGKASNRILTAIVFLSPFGREMANHPDFRTPLIICSIVTGLWIATFIWVYFFSGDKCVPIGILMCVLSMGTWYICFWSCYLMQTLYAFNNFIGILATIIAALFINFLTTGIATVLYEIFS